MSDGTTSKSSSRSITVTYDNQRLRDIASACLGGGFVLGLVSLGEFASKGVSSALAIVLAMLASTLLALFGIVWDWQHPRTRTPAERTRPGMTGLPRVGWVFLIAAGVLHIVSIVSRT